MSLIFLLVASTITSHRGGGAKIPQKNREIDWYMGTWDKEDKDGKETEHMRGAKLVTGDAGISRMANKTDHICG